MGEFADNGGMAGRAYHNLALVSSKKAARKKWRHSTQSHPWAKFKEDRGLLLGKRGDKVR